MRRGWSGFYCSWHCTPRKALLSRHSLPDGLLSSRLRVSLLVRISAEFWFVLVEASIARLVAAIV